MTEANAVLASVWRFPLRLSRPCQPATRSPIRCPGPSSPARSPPPRIRSPASTSGWPKARSARAGSRAPILPTPAACLWLEGELVHLEDLVLHDASMDIRAPTHELTRAHAVLRTRRRIADAKPDWALSAGRARKPARPGRAGRPGGGEATTGRKGRRRRRREMMPRTRWTARISISRSASSKPTRGSPPPSPRSTPRSRNPTERSPARPRRRSRARSAGLRSRLGRGRPSRRLARRRRSDPQLAADAGGGDRGRGLGPDRTAAAHAVARPPARRGAAPRDAAKPARTCRACMPG